MLRIRKSVKVLPGVRLNLSKGGTSWTLGRPGASVNVGGKRGPRATVGMPGTGVSVSVPLKSASGGAAHEAAPRADVVSALAAAVRSFIGWAVIGAVLYAIAKVASPAGGIVGGLTWLPTVCGLLMAVRTYRRRRAGVA